MSDPTERPPATAESEAVSADGRHLRDLIPEMRLQMAVFLAVVMLYTLYFAREIVLPVMLALVLNLLLSPVVRWLSKFRIPRGLSAWFVVMGFLAGCFASVYWLSGPATEWLQKAPDLFGQIEQKTSVIREGIEQVSEATKQIEEMASDVLDEEKPLFRRPVEVNVSTEPGWRASMFDNARAIAGSLIITLSLLYFLLATGDMMLRKVIGLFPERSSRSKAVDVAEAVQQEISHYLLSITAINVALGAIVGCLLWALGLPNPFLWGALLTILNFLPYIGAIAAAVVVFMVSLATFDGLSEIILPPLALLFCTGMEGMVITPFLLGFRMSLNPVLIFVAILFWGWLWGIVGVLLAVPLMAIAKVTCVRVGGPLKPWGRLLSS